MERGEQSSAATHMLAAQAVNHPDSSEKPFRKINTHKQTVARGCYCLISPLSISYSFTSLLFLVTIAVLMTAMVLLEQ